MKTLLFNKNTPWINKEGNEDFAVTMGCFDGAEVCQIVGTYILSQLKIPLGTIKLGFIELMVLQ